MKKRILAMILVTAMLLTFAACAGKEDGEPDGETRRRGGNDSELIQTQTSAQGVSVLASDYDEIYTMIMELNERNNARYATSARDGAVAVAEGASFDDSADMAPMANMMLGEEAEVAYDAPAGGGGDMAMGGGNGSDDFSDTNNQVEGVQESDIVKTDGKNIYITTGADNSVNVIAVNNGNMEHIAKIQNSRENANVREMLLYDGKLIIIWSSWEQVEIQPLNSDDEAAQNRMMDYYWGWGKYHWVNETIVDIYATNGSFDGPIYTYTQSGWYNSTRMIGSNIYIISNFNPPNMMQFAREDLQFYIPSYSVNGNVDYVPANAIVLPDKLEYVEYTVIGGLDINNSQSETLVSITSSLGGSHMIYSSLNNIYLTRTDYEYGDDWSWWQNYTVINKFSVSAGKVSFVASGRVKGNVGTQFYMDEHNGIFRIVTEVWGEVEPTDNNWWGNWGPHGASLYTMDANLNVLDEVHQIGFGENVQSVRFDGDIGYIVTFFMVDPLFSFDLSDPRNIVQLDELKIPGFSRYMHRWADGLLLGIGVDADEEDGMRTGLKVSMFDTSDNENLSEKHVYIIEMANENNNQDWWSDDWAWSWFWSPAEHQHKSILICPDKNIIGFPYTYSFSSRNHWTQEMMYVIFSYDADNGFTLLNEFVYDTGDDDSWWYGNGFQRGLYIGDYLYVIADDRVISAHLSTAEIVQELRFFDVAKWYADMQAQWELEWAQWEEEW
ncbi:MAG: beta-propeller domain-containing protein, partial [Oscillospiraceae bacterium]|nr:beta-propeller domain-containing protein [Oscillospiraceae bacterium]